MLTVGQFSTLFYTHAMKIAFCIFKYQPFGGLQRDFLRIAQCAKKRGHKVTVFTCAWQGERPVGFELHVFKPKALTNHTQAIQFSKLVQANFKHFDCVIGFNRMPGLDLYFAGDLCYKAVIEANKPAWVRWLPRYRTFLALEQAVFGKSSNTVSLLLDPQEKRRIQKYYQTPDQRLVLLPPGIDKDRIPKEGRDAIRHRVRQALGLGEAEHMLVMVGSDFYRKGVDRAIEALAELPKTTLQKTRLFVIGEGRHVTYLKLATKLGVQDHLVFLGPREDVPECLLAADSLLHVARAETAGMVLIEAIVASLPVVVTSHCGYAPYIIEAGCGVMLSSPFDPKQCAAILDQLLRREVADFRAHAKQYVATHDLFGLTDSVVDQIEKIARQTHR